MENHRKYQLNVEEKGGFLSVTCPEMPGLNLCSTNHEAVWHDIPKAIKGIRTNWGEYRGETSIAPQKEIK